MLSCIGEKHLSSATEHVSKHWGIICVTEDKIETVREASANPKASLPHQLWLLWKTELKNILAKNKMPRYPQKSKAFIISRLMEKVDHDALKKQVVEELFCRDYTVFNN